MRIDKNVGRANGLGRQRGFTLIEALVVMIVGIVILAAAAAGIGKLFRSSEISTEVSNITQIAANMRNLKGGPKSYQNVDNKLLMQFKAIPANMSQTADGVITNSWGGNVKVEPRYESGFMITYEKVPPEACMQLTLKLRGTGGGWSWYTINGKADRVTTPLKADKIADLCKKEQNTISLESS